MWNLSLRCVRRAERTVRSVLPSSELKLLSLQLRERKAIDNKERETTHSP